MSDRYTIKDAERAFHHLAFRLGWAESYNQVGGYSLDYAPIYGGVRIVRVINERGGISDITDRMTPREFCQAVRFFNAVNPEGRA